MFFSLTHSDRGTALCHHLPLPAGWNKTKPSERSSICVSMANDGCDWDFVPPPSQNTRLCMIVFFIETNILVVSVIVSHFPFSAVSWLVRSNQSPTDTCNWRGSWVSTRAVFGGVIIYWCRVSEDVFRLGREREHVLTRWSCEILEMGRILPLHIRWRDSLSRRRVDLRPNALLWTAVLMVKCASTGESQITPKTL